MSDFRRWWLPGGTYLFTAVTHGRAPLFAEESARTDLREAIATIRRRHPFEMRAIVLLLDHLHTIWTLPPNDADFATRWRLIKDRFTRAHEGGKPRSAVPEKRAARGERCVWQRRFWEHCCRDEADLGRCLGYMLYNPAKHRLVRSVADYPHSSFHRLVAEGAYPADWGGVAPADWDDCEEGE